MSGLRHAVEDYLSMRRSLGFKLERHARLLPDLVAYLETADASTLTTQLAMSWATALAGKPDEWAIRLSIARGFAAYLQTLDPATEVPPPDLLPRKRRRANPYLYTDAEITALMAAAQTLRFPLRTATYQTLIGILATTGMRPGEARALDREDFDPQQRRLLVRNAKFGDTRQLPLHHSTVDALVAYTQLRDQHRPRPKTSALFVSMAGTRLLQVNVNSTFRLLVDVAGLRPRSGSCRPRLHDFRHRLVVITLIEWYSAGVDVAARMPALSAFLGHSSPAFTYWYASAAPELLALAAERLEQNGSATR